jgi:hypothetical protein
MTSIRNLRGKTYAKYHLFSRLIKELSLFQDSSPALKTKKPVSLFGKRALNYRI